MHVKRMLLEMAGWGLRQKITVLWLTTKANQKLEGDYLHDTCYEEVRLFNLWFITEQVAYTGTVLPSTVPRFRRSLMNGLILLVAKS